MVLITEILPGSSSSSLTHDHNHRFDVFLSFRGLDTRNGFTDHLYHALLDANLTTFLDDEEIEIGEPLKPELESAIQSSRASVIVLSTNYASSTWCLDELVLILEQKRKFNQIVIPIFYHVEPNHVRKQQSSFGEAMAKHKEKMEAETDAEKRCQLALKMESWKMALTQVADLKGKDAKDRKEREVIKEVVADIHYKLRVPLCNTLPRLIGMDYDINFIGSWLTDGSHHIVDILTIVGIGGIGKTYLAKYVFGLHSGKFDKSSFVQGIDARCNERVNGLLTLQKQLHGDISKNIELRVNDCIEYTSKIENVLARKRVFIVLDDIGSLEQLDALLGNKGLHPGSKVIVTTKDASLTKRCVLFKSQVHHNYKEVFLNGLYKSTSLKLLCIHAFHSQNPTKGYEEVSKELVKYCDGHPLAIEVLGKSLYQQDVSHWEDYIKVLKKEPHTRINTALKLSFDALLHTNDKELFKHIACFFVGKDRDATQTILDACDINTKIGMRNLVDKSLLSIEPNNELAMHSLIREMGRNLVRQESPFKPWKRSRLWCPEESFEVLKQNKGKQSLLGLALDMIMLNKKEPCGSFELKTNSFSRMDNLMLLQLNFVQLNGCFKKFPKDLRWLCMHGSPLKSIPLDLPMDNLVALDMSNSNIESFGVSSSYPQPHVKRHKGLMGSSSKDKRYLGSLKILNLSFCEKLHSVGGFFKLPALERLILRNCISLIEVCELVDQCHELIHIDLSYCYNIRKVSNSICKLKKVKTLLLDGWSPCESEIKMGNVKAIPSDSKFFMISLPNSVRTLSLVGNNLSNESFPFDFSCMSMLKELFLGYNSFVSMPSCVRTLPRLEILNMDECPMMTSIENPPCTLRELTVDVYKYLLPSVRKLKLNPDMSPLKLSGCFDPCVLDIEADGILKIHDIANVEEKVLHTLGWTDLDFIKERRFKSTYSSRGIEDKTQMFYEFGIFSTFYEGKEMPDWISCRSEGSSISFTIPSSSKKLRGLNFICMDAFAYGDSYKRPDVKISNITKNLTWIYNHYVIWVDAIEADFDDREECHVCVLSHWMFGPNEMKVGDHITITVEHIKNYVTRSLGSEEFYIPRIRTKACGIGFVYEDDIDEKTEEEDALGYYKSWNHIIGGDLSGFQLTTGEYILDFCNFGRHSVELVESCPFIDRSAIYKEERMWFKAFSGKNKSSEDVQVPCDVGNAIQLVDTSENLALANASSTYQSSMLEVESEAKVNMEY